MRTIAKKHRLIVAVLSLTLAALMGAGSTLAYVMTQTQAKENEFTSSKVASEVYETFDGEVKSNVGVKNVGDTEAYVRAAIVVTWAKTSTADDMTVVSAKKPQAGVDYSLSYKANSGWILGDDGFWYYSLPVAAGSKTEVLISECRLAAGASAPEGYRLSVEIVCSSVQSTPTSAVYEAWGATVDDSGKLQPKTGEVTE